MISVQVRRLTFGTIFRLMAIGLSCTLVPLFLLNAVGLDIIDLQWNDEPLKGAKALIIAPIMGVAFSLLLALFLGSLIAIGLWLFSFVRPFKVDYIPSEHTANTGAAPSVDS